MSSKHQAFHALSLIPENPIDDNNESAYTWSLLEVSFHILTIIGYIKLRKNYYYCIKDSYNKKYEINRNDLLYFINNKTLKLTNGG